MFLTLKHTGNAQDTVVFYLDGVEVEVKVNHN